VASIDFVGERFGAKSTSSSEMSFTAYLLFCSWVPCGQGYDIEAGLNPAQNKSQMHELQNALKKALFAKSCSVSGYSKLQKQPGL